MLDNLNKLWDEDSETRALILKRARRQTITYYRARYQDIPSQALGTSSGRMSCKVTEKNWFSAPQRPLSMASFTDKETQTGKLLLFPNSPITRKYHLCLALTQNMCRRRFSNCMLAAI